MAHENSIYSGRIGTLFWDVKEFQPHTLCPKAFIPDFFPILKFIKFHGNLTHVYSNARSHSETDNLLSKPSSDEKTAAQVADVAEKKMSNSKELSKEKAELESHLEHGGSIVGIIYSAAKKVAMVGAVYFIGYMNWSVS